MLGGDPLVGGGLELPNQEEGLEGGTQPLPGWGMLTVAGPGSSAGCKGPQGAGARGGISPVQDRAVVRTAESQARARHPSWDPLFMEKVPAPGALGFRGAWAPSEDRPCTR